jgi:hypothetical protein
LFLEVLPHGGDYRRNIGVGLAEEAFGLRALPRRPEHRLAFAVLAVEQDGQQQTVMDVVAVEKVVPQGLVQLDRRQKAFAPIGSVDFPVRLLVVDRFEARPILEVLGDGVVGKREFLRTFFP